MKTAWDYTVDRKYHTDFTQNTHGAFLSLDKWLERALHKWLPENHMANW